MRFLRTRNNSKRIILTVTSAQSLRLLNGFPDFLASYGWDVHVVSSGDIPSASVAWTHHHLSMNRRPSPLQDGLALWQWICLLARLNPGIIVAGTPKAGLLGIVGSAIVGTPVRVYLLRGLRLSTEAGIRRRVLNAVERVSMRTCTVVQSVSPSLAAEVVNLGLCPAAKILVVGKGSSNGVDLPDASELEVGAPQRRAELHLPERPTIGFVGRLNPDKGLDTLLTAFFQLLSHVDAQLLLIGPQEQEGYLNAQLNGRSEDFRKRVIWTGPLTEPAQHYRAMDILCLPTKREGFPNVVLEAGAHGVPVVASSVTGCVDAIQHNETGLLFPVGDAVALSRELLQLLNNPLDRTNIAARAYSNIEASYTRQNVWSLTEQFYISLLTNRREEHVS